MTDRRVWSNLRPVIGMGVLSALVAVPQLLVGWWRRRKQRAHDQKLKQWREEYHEGLRKWQEEHHG